MKKITLLLVSFWLMTAFVIAQTPQAFKYQAVARNSTGNLIQNQLVAFRISILQGSPSGTLLYQERHTPNTNNYGLANLDIGNGTVLSGSFSSINWSVGQMYIKVELDPLGGTAYQNMGTMQLLSVPYALHSNTSAGLTLPYSGSGSSSTSALSITNTGTGNGISGTAANSSGYGIYGTAPVTGIKGVATNGSGESYGVYGQTSSAQGYGVYGKVTVSSGVNYGVWGEAPSEFGFGVSGTGGRTGVIGNASKEAATGVEGINSFETGNGLGVLGYSASVSGAGIRAVAASSNGINYGVYSTTQSPTGFGIFGSGPVTGIRGEGTNGTGTSYGVYGTTESPSGFGVFGSGPVAGIRGVATNEYGENYGVYGESASPEGKGVFGKASASSGNNPIGVYGESSQGAGIYGANLYGGLYPYGVYGISYSPYGIGVCGNGEFVGVYGGAAIGVYGTGIGSNSFSGKFTNGKFYVDGNIGIGTEAPDCQLVIQAPDNQSRNMLLIRNGSGSERIQMRQNSNGSGGIWLYNGSDVNTIFLYGDGTSYINSGNLGIGTTSPTELLDVSGNGRFRAIGSGAYSGPVNRTSNGTLTTATSDIRLKENIHTLQNSLDKVMHLRGVSFTWKADPEMGTRIGFIAQELEQVIPELVFTNEVDGYKGINYAEVNAVLVEAIKELNSKIDNLENKNEQLNYENKKINARLDKIESLMSLSAEK